MLAGALGTYAAALIVVAASTASGAGLLAASGVRQWSWTAPAVGLAAIAVVAWWAVRLPGHGLTALVAITLLAVLGAAFATLRMEVRRSDLTPGLPVLALALLLASVPFVADGHFGVLGTGFNVDMSQHLFAANWIADPAGAPPGLFDQGYPLAPHALAVATGEVSGELATSFSGVTIVAPVIAALTALGALGGWPRWRATIVAALAAFAYLAASYLAQGSFKELYEASFLLGFVICLRELSTPVEGSRGWRSGLPPAVLGAGALYAYSGPGLAWLAAALGVWGTWEMFRRRADLADVLRRAMPVLVGGLAALALLAAPELDRIADFGGSVGTVSDRATSGASAERLLAGRGDSEAGRRGEPRFDNDLGNLFGQINPLEAFGVWPSGDFRVAPGDGAIPAGVFYLGALLGALALALGIAAALGRGETALPAALVAAVAIWLAARLLSTPYTTAKALGVLAPIAMLLAARWALDPDGGRPARESRASIAGRVLAVAFVAAATLSSGLAIANAPVGPREYSPGVTALAPSFAGAPTLLLAPADVLAEERGRDFYGWELRDADPACVAAAPARPGDEPAPFGIRFVITTDGVTQPPFAGIERRGKADDVLLWAVRGWSPGNRPGVPGRGSTDCVFELSARGDAG